MRLTEAAGHLGVTTRMVRNYINEGMLTTARKGKEIILDPIQVEQLRADRAAAKTKKLLPTAELQVLRSRVHRLEHQMETVLRILDAKDHPLGLAGDAATQLHLAAKGACVLPDIPLEFGAMWLDVLLRLTEDDFTEIQSQTSDAQPWRPFLQLCNSLILLVGKQPELQTSLELQTLHRGLIEAKRRLRVSATLFIEQQGGIAPAVAELLWSPTSVREAVEKVLKSKA